MFPLYENVAALYNKTYKIYNSYKKPVSLLFGLANSTVTVSALAGGSHSGLEVLSPVVRSDNYSRQV